MKTKKLKTPDGTMTRQVIYRDWQVSGSAGDQNAVEIVVNDEGRLLFGTCACAFFKDNLLNKGPCEHLAALLAASAPLAQGPADFGKGVRRAAGRRSRPRAKPVAQIPISPNAAESQPRDRGREPPSTQIAAQRRPLVGAGSVRRSRDAHRAEMLAGNNLRRAAQRRRGGLLECPPDFGSIGVGKVSPLNHEDVDSLLLGVDPRLRAIRAAVTE